MKSLKTRFFLLFAVLGILVSLGVGLIMYIQYDRYIKSIYQKTLQEVAVFIEKQYPQFQDSSYLVDEADKRSDEFWKITQDMQNLTDSFGLAYIYFLQRINNEYIFTLSLTYTPQDFEGFVNFAPYPPELDVVYKTRKFQLSAPYVDEWGTFVSIFYPVMKGGEVIGVIGADYEVSFVKDLERHAVTALIISLLLAAGISGAFAFAVSSSLIKPIRHAMSALKTIAEGDLTSQVEASGNDELGEMMRFLKETQDSIKLLVIAIGNKAKSLSKIGDELAAMMSQSAAAIHQISATTQGMKQKAHTQAVSVTETNATMGQIATNINALNTNIEAQAKSVSRSSTAVEQMTENIASVTQSLLQNERNVQDLQAAAEQGHTALQQVSTDIREVTKESERLLEINQVIKQIASQTNLLSMNAAIEAAHAGEVGKGFAVVADEIRKLAESSSEQAKTVSEVLKKIKGSLDGIGGSTGAALNHFDAIDTGVKIVSEQEAHIRNAMEGQDAGSREILSTIAVSNDITQKVRDGSEAMLTGSKEVIGEGTNLDALTADLTSGMNETALGMEQINTAVTRIQGISQENKQNIEALVQEIMKFKIA
ncbi:MAG: methyl-accepting chemotaxis protein [Treponema sp.]|jgi:methyl-accepting chemotaxis protein|nr:methyl-accepting chemotaxis protein [Treponema sp.]